MPKKNTMGFIDYYETLFITGDATHDQIKTAYKELAKKHHPDVNKNANSLYRMQMINEAYEVLDDPESKLRYDKMRFEYYRTPIETPPLKSDPPIREIYKAWILGFFKIRISKKISGWLE
jgi:curved DNA-binding protein CbpA